jgi:hypothetical protein
VRQELSDGRFGGSPIPTSTGFISARTTKWANLYQLGAPFWLSAEAVYSVYGYRDMGSDRLRVRLELEPFVNLGFHF